MSQQIPVEESRTDKYLHFFQNLARGLLPYLELFVSRSQRGGSGGISQMKSRRFQIPVTGPGGTQQGGQIGPPGIKIITPAQSGVLRARALLKEDQKQSRDLEDSLATKPKTVRSRNHKRAGRSRGNNSSSTTVKKRKAPSKAPPTRKKRKTDKGLIDALS